MATSKNGSKPDGAFLSLDTDVTKNAERILLSATHMQGMMFNAMLKYNLEAARFLQHRLEEDLKTAETFAKCSTITEFSEAGTEFCQRAMEEYGEEATKLTSLGIGLVTKTAENVQAEAARTTVQ